MKDLRIGLVEFSNAAPLAATLPPHRVRRGAPGEVATWLRDGEVDVALSPAIHLARQPGTRALPGWGVGADGRCDSVLLFSRGPLAEVRRVALDGASRSAAALVRVLLDREGADRPEFEVRREGTVERRLADVDAALLIGDPALQAEVPAGVTRWDLAAEWKRHVGLPFVFALWVARSDGVLGPEESAALVRSARAGLDDLDGIAAREAERLGVSAERLAVYLRSLDHRLTARHRQGLETFLAEAARVGEVEPVDDLDARFVAGDWA